MTDDEDFLFEQMMIATERVVVQSPTSVSSAADPRRFRVAVPKVERRGSIRRFRSGAAIPRDDLCRSLRTAFECDASGHCTTASAGNIQGLEAIAVRQDGAEVLPVTPGRAFGRGAPRQVDLGKALFEQFSGAYWAVVFYVDPRPYVGRYAARAFRHIFIEGGLMAAQVERLAAAAGWSGCLVGGFDDRMLRKILHTECPHLAPVCLYVVGLAEGDR